MLYNEHGFLDRFAAAAQDGFNAVEYLFPYAFKAQDLQQRLQDHGLQQVLFNAPPGVGTRASAAWPACPDAKPNFAMALPRHWTTPLPCPARACM